MHLPADLPPPATERLRLMQEVRLGLLGVAERLRQNWHAHAAAAGLSTAQVNALLSLTPGEAVPMRSLAARLDYDASNLSVLVDRLERRGLVERRPDPGDRRVKALALTAEGERLRATFWRQLLEDAGPLAPLADSELEALGALLGVLAAGDRVGGAADAVSSGPAAASRRGGQ
jgi:DNA-binding MarR family transcriptional regulator